MLDGSPLLGRTFRTGSATALKSAIEDYLAIDAGERRRAIASTVDQLSPERVVLPFVNALRARDARSRAASATTLPGA